MNVKGIRVLIRVGGSAFRWVMLTNPYCDRCDLFVYCVTHGLRERPKCPCDMMPPHTGVFRRVRMLDVMSEEGL